MHLNQPCIIIALSAGALLVGRPIARALRCDMALLVSRDVSLPGEPAPLGTMMRGGEFVYNNYFSTGEIEEFNEEFHGYIEDQKREKLTELNRLLAGSGDLQDAKALRGKVVIAVADGLRTGLSLAAAAMFVKYADVARFVIVCPVVSVQAVDRMHILGDEIHCLGVTENYITTDHYYDENILPTPQEVLALTQNGAYTG